jgi:hypothetical protein
MSELRTRFERAAEQFRPTVDWLQGAMQRARHRQRFRRLMSATFALVLFAGAFALLWALRPALTEVPAGPPACPRNWAKTSRADAAVGSQRSPPRRPMTCGRSVRVGSSAYRAHRRSSSTGTASGGSGPRARTARPAPVPRTSSTVSSRSRRTTRGRSGSTRSRSGVRFASSRSAGTARAGRSCPRRARLRLRTASRTSQPQARTASGPSGIRWSARMQRHSSSAGTVSDGRSFRQPTSRAVGAGQT